MLTALVAAALLAPAWSPGLRPANAYAGGRPGTVRRFVAARIDKLLDAFDGVRIDHPHGLVCPWVYRTDIPDAYTAVQTGARLFSSPDAPEHPGQTLASLAALRADLRQILAAAIAAADAGLLVERALTRGMLGDTPVGPTDVVAVGKAAVSMPCSA